MPETKVIDTVSTISLFLNEVEIYNEFINDIFANLLTLGFFIPSSNGSQGGVNYKPGDLIVNIVQYPTIDYLINSNGELILVTQGADANFYTVDNDNGNLEYVVTT